jgi:hypothetical protein
MPPAKQVLPATVLAEIQAATAALPSRSDKVRTAASILFFTHGIYPSGQNVYQAIRYGSLADISADLREFWEDIRTKAKVRINAPLPDVLLDKFSVSLSDAWDIACAEAANSFAHDRENMRIIMDSMSQDVTESRRMHTLAIEEIAETRYALQAKSEALNAKELELVAANTHGQELTRQVQEWRDLTQAAENARAQAQLQFTTELGLMREQSKAEIARFDADLKHFKLEAYTARVAEKDATEKMTRESVKAQEALKAMREAHLSAEKEWVTRIGVLQTQVKTLEAAQAKEVEPKVVVARKRVFVAKIGRFTGKKSLR